MHIDRVGETREIKLIQKKYIKNLLQKLNMENCNASSTPLESNVKLTKPEQ